MTYPPRDDRLRHLIAQEINPHVASWKLAFFIAEGIVTSRAVRGELTRIAEAHAAGEHCGDRNCEHCWTASVTAEDPAAVPSAPADRSALLQRIATAVQGVLPMSSSLACDVVADAVLAVLPETDQPGLLAKVDEATATLRRIRSTIRTLKERGATGQAYYQAIADDLAGPRPDRDEASGPSRVADEAQQTPEPESGCAHCGGDHAWDDCEAYTALVADEAQQPETQARCGAWGGCTLARGHNIGQADIPENHRPAVGAQQPKEA